MEFTISKEMAEFLKGILKEDRPYPLSVLDELMFDDKRFDPRRIGATDALNILIKAGYSEDEVNPWIDDR